MRYNNRSHAFPFELQHQFQQCLRIRFIQGRSGLIQNQQANFLCQCLCNFHKLLFAYANVFDQRSGRFLQAHGF